MGRPRGNQRDAFTPSGAGARTDDEFPAQDVPAFVAKYGYPPPYLDPKIRKRQRGAQGGD